MNEVQRKLLQRHRVRLVTSLRPDPLYDPLVAKEIFTEDMIEEIKNSGTRRDQARQLVTDLQTRGTRAFPAFLESLEETGQHELIELLREGLSVHDTSFTAVQPVEPWKGYKPVPRETWSSRPIQCTDTDHIVPRKPTMKKLQDDMKQCLYKPLGMTLINVDVQRDLILRRKAIYKMDADPCGCCLIINNVDFVQSSGLACRAGSDIDCENVQNLFQKLHFDVIVKRNLTKHLMIEELKNLARKNHKDYDCCIVVILSHGSQAQHRQFPGAIYGVDGGQPVPVQHIVSYFDGSHCPTLREKPKLFFIQACGGDLKDTGFRTAEEVDSAISTLNDPISLQTDATPSPAEDEPDARPSLPTTSDILVSYSTFPGYVSWRDKKEGSWYMKTLVQVFSKYAHSDDLQTLLTWAQITESNQERGPSPVHPMTCSTHLEVTRSISENEEAKGVYKQIPGSFNFLRKHFYFFNKEKQ